MAFANAHTHMGTIISLKIEHMCQMLYLFMCSFDKRASGLGPTYSSSVRVTDVNMYLCLVTVMAELFRFTSVLQQVIQSGLSDDDKVTLIEAHNHFRSNHSLTYGAQNMQKVVSIFQGQVQVQYVLQNRSAYRESDRG
jgi:hypothetical protein